MPSLRGKRQSSLWLQAHADSWLCVNYSSVPVLIGLRGSDPQQVLGCSHTGSWLADLWAHKPSCAPWAVSQPLNIPFTGAYLPWLVKKQPSLGCFICVFYLGEQLFGLLAAVPGISEDNLPFSGWLCRYACSVVLAEVLSKEKIRLRVNVCQSDLLECRNRQRYKSPVLSLLGYSLFSRGVEEIWRSEVWSHHAWAGCEHWRAVPSIPPAPQRLPDKTSFSE